MSTMTAPRKSGKSKSKPADVFSLALAINHQVYNVTAIRGIQDPEIVQCWRLEKASDADSVYDVAVHRHGRAECSCPDWTARHHDFNTAGCKHVRACREMGLIAAEDPTARHADPAVMAEETPAEDSEPCCDDAEAPCSTCLTSDAHAPFIPPAPFELGLPPEDDEDDQGDDDEPWGADDVVGLGLDPEWGARRLPKGPDPISQAWEAGYTAGKASAEDEIRDLELDNARLRAELESLRAELVAVGH